MKAVFARTVIWRVAATSAAAVASFLAVKLYSHYLGNGGLFAVVLTAQQILGNMSILDGGFRLATNRALLAEPDDSKRLKTLQFAQTMTWMSGLAGALVGLTLMAIYSLAPNIVKSGVGLSFLLGFGIIGGAALSCIAQVQMLTGLGLQRRVFALNSLNSVVFLGVVWIALRSHLGPWAFLIAMAVSQLVNGGVAVMMAKAAVPQLRVFRIQFDSEFRQMFRAYWRDAWAAFRMQIIIVILYGSDVVVVSTLCQGVAADVYVLLARLFFVVRQALQAADESLWPSIAARSQKASEVSGVLLRLNGWLYGSAMSAAAVTLPMFIACYTPEKGRPEAGLAALFGLRFLITGLSSQPSYYLYGKGRFDLILRYHWREFAAAMVLAIPLGLQFGTRGVAAGYLIATVAGTLWSFPKSYADGTGRPLGEVFGGMWLRAVLASIVSAGVALAILRFGYSWPLAVAAGACGAAAAILWATGWAWWQTGTRGSFPGAAKLAEHL